MIKIKKPKDIDRQCNCCRSTYFVMEICINENILALCSKCRTKLKELLEKV
jgi:hypothetical protein